MCPQRAKDAAVNNIPDLFRDELNPGERLIWTGRPQQGLILRASDWFFIPFSLLWGGFAIFWEYLVITSGAPGFIWLFGIPFILVALYLLFGRFFVDQARRAKTYYAITNERVIILSGLMNQEVKTLIIKNLPEINTTRTGSGSGTITFGPTHPFAWLYTGSGFPDMGRYNISPAFDSIEDVKTVYQIVKRLQKENK
jgi:hypothetical protein